MMPASEENTPAALNTDIHINRCIKQWFFLINSIVGMLHNL